MTKELFQHSAFIEARNKSYRKTPSKENYTPKEKVMSIVDYESFNEIPFESFIMQTVFENETSLQHPYEFIDEKYIVTSP